MLKKALAHFPDLRRDFGQPDRRFDRLNLTKERTNAAEVVVPPVLKQARRLRSYAPVIRVGQTPPFVNLVADRIDDRGVVVLLLGR